MAPKEAQSSTFGNNHKHFEHDVGASFDAYREVVPFGNWASCMTLY